MIRRIVMAAGTLGLAFVAWLTVGPASLHGPNHYMITSGTSMLPTIQPQSAVVIRHEGSYHVGEIVAYHNPDLGGAIVLHRIIHRDGARYVFKGDNNDAPDFYEPTVRQIVGARVWSSHGVGLAVLRLRSPILGALMLGGVALWIMWPGRSKRPVRPRHRAGRGSRTGPDRPDDRSPRPEPRRPSPGPVDDPRTLTHC